MLVLAAISELGHLVNLPSQAEGVPSTAIPPMLQLTNWLLMGHCFSFLDNAGFSSLNYCVSLALFIPFSSFSASCSSFFLFSYKVLVFLTTSVHPHFFPYPTNFPFAFSSSVLSVSFSLLRTKDFEFSFFLNIFILLW